MSAISWKVRFFGKLRWSLLWGNWKRRQQVKLERRARRKHDGLASQLEECETRVMLSGTTAVNDQAILNQVGVPITLDVLSNDISGNGQLNIVSASVVGGSGTVVIIDGQTAASGAEARDRVKVTLNSGFTGNAQLQYTIQDDAGNQSTATASLSIGPSQGDAFTGSSGGGKLSVNGGTGHGFKASPTSSYIPTEWGNYTYTVGIANATYNTQGASGTQSITKVVTTTSYGVANWSYSELVTWVYDVYANDGNGNTKHEWGVTTYLFSSASVNGVITTFLDLHKVEHHDNHVTILSSGASEFLHEWGTNTIHITIVNINDVVDSGSSYYFHLYDGGTLGNGTYSYAMADGVISGTSQRSSDDFETTTVSLTFVQLPTGGYGDGGFFTNQGHGTSHFSYSGSGSYTEVGMQMIGYDSGSENTSYNFNGAGGHAQVNGIGTWITQGVGVFQGDESHLFSYSGSGSYSQEFHGGIMVGTRRRSGDIKSNASQHFDYGFGMSGWQVVNGDSSASGSRLDVNEYDGSGTYTFPTFSSGYSEVLTGSMQESGYGTERSKYSIAGDLDIGTMQWSYTGSGTGSGTKSEFLSYSGTGGYSRATNGGTVFGVSSEEYNLVNSAAYSSQQQLVNNSQWITAGSGEFSGLAVRNLRYSGTGSYEHWDDPQTKFSGEQRESGNTDETVRTEYSWQKQFYGDTEADGRVDASSDGVNYQYMSGSASYSRPTAQSSSVISGTINEEVSRRDRNQTLVVSELDSTYSGMSIESIWSPRAQDWVLVSGSGSAESDGITKRNWSGTGTYGRTWQESSGNEQTTFSGTYIVQEGGNYFRATSASSITSLSGSSWIKTSGSATAWGTTSGSSYVSNFGTYTKVRLDKYDYRAEFTGTFEEFDETHESKSWNEGFVVQDGNFVLSSGHAEGSGGGKRFSSNSGTGTYGHEHGIYNASISGEVNEESIESGENSFTFESNWDSATGWVTTGQLTESGFASGHFDYSGSGAMDTLNTFASGRDSGVGAYQGWVNEKGEKNDFSDKLEHYAWDDEEQPENPESSGGLPSLASSSPWKLVSGSGSDWGNSYDHKDWSGTKHYSSSGFDNRFGHWNVSGWIKASGYDDERDKWTLDKSVVVASGVGSWVAVGGSGSNWGYNEELRTFSGSGKWQLPSGLGWFGATSGSMSQSGFELDTQDWNKQLTFQNGSLKVAGGTAHETFDSLERNEFAIKSTGYVNTAVGWLTGTARSYGIDQTTVEMDGDLSWNVASGKWELNSGSGLITTYAAIGKNYSGSGTFDYGSASGSGWQSGSEEFGGGGYLHLSASGHEFVAGASGQHYSGFSNEDWGWQLSGSSTSGTVQYDFSNEKNSHFSSNFNLIVPQSGSASGAIQIQFDHYHKESYSIQDIKPYDTYLESQLMITADSGAINYKWDGSRDLTKNHWLANSGGVQDSTYLIYDSSFSSAGSSSGSGSVAYWDIERSYLYKLDSKESYSVIPQPALANPPDERDVKWDLIGGTHYEKEVFSDYGWYSSSGGYINADYGFSGTTNYEVMGLFAYDWNRTSVNDGTAWTTTGTGKRKWVSLETGARQGSGTFLTNGGSGFAWESSKDTVSFGYIESNWTWMDFGTGNRPDGPLHDAYVGPEGMRNQASGLPYSGTVGMFLKPGSGAGKAFGFDEAGVQKTESWSPVVVNAPLNGTKSTDVIDRYDYEENSVYQLNAAENKFLLTDGSGTYDYFGHETITGSATGAYSYSFDDGKGIFNGQASASFRDHFDYVGHGESQLFINGSSKTWVLTSNSGDANFDGFGKSNYSGDGSYDITTTTSTGFSRHSASLEESGETNGYYSRSYHFNNGDYSLSSSSWGDSQFKYTYHRATAYSNTTTDSGPGYTYITKSSGMSDLLQKYSGNSKYLNTRNETSASGVVTWTRTASGAASSVNEEHSVNSSRTDWNNHSTSGNTSSFYVGYSSVTTDNYDKWTLWQTWDNVTRQDGSATHSVSSGGSHQWNWQTTVAFNIAWGQTTTYGGSGYGSGGGYTYSTGGSAIGAWTSGSGGYTSWANSMYSSTPGTPSSSQPSNYAPPSAPGSDIEIDTNREYGPINAVMGLPDLGSDTVPDYENLGWTLTIGIHTYVFDTLDAFRSYLDNNVAELLAQADNFAKMVIKDSLRKPWRGPESHHNAVMTAGAIKTVAEIAAEYLQRPGRRLDDYKYGVDVEQRLDELQFDLGMAGMFVGLLPEGGTAISSALDLTNAAISYARGDTEEAKNSVIYAIPFIGDAKAGYDTYMDVWDAGRKVECEVKGDDGCFVAGTKVLISALASSTAPSSPPGPLVATQTAMAIESIPVGTRLIGHNPQDWDTDYSMPEPDDSWLVAKMSVKKDNGIWVDVEMIRPAAFWHRAGAFAGGQIMLTFAELEISNLAKIHSLEPTPPIAIGEGNVVTARMTTRQTHQLVRVQFSDQTTLIGTPAHPIWSVSEQDWVDLEELDEGDLVLGESGPLEVVSTELIETLEPVYNLEVYGEHVYHVENSGILVHNGRGGRCKGPKAKKVRTPARLTGPVQSQHYSTSAQGRKLHDSAQKYRNAAKFGPYRNIATADVTVNGIRKIVHFKNDPDFMHSEQRLVAWHKLMTDRGNEVIVHGVYSERPPCGAFSANCRETLGNYFGRFLDVWHGDR